MKTESLWKWIVLVLLLAFSFTLISKKENIRLGLDLNGGYSFTLEVDKAELENSIKTDFTENGRDINDDKVKDEIAKEISRRISATKESSIEVIRSRIDSLGTTEPIIYAGSGNTEEENCRIYVQMPMELSEKGEDAAAQDEKYKRAKDLVCSVAFLEFRLVSPNNEILKQDLLAKKVAPSGYKLGKDANNQDCYIMDPKSGVDYTSEQHASDLRKFGNAISGTVFMLEKATDKNNQTCYYPIYVKKKCELTGDSIVNASIERDPMSGKQRVSLEFDSDGREKFANLTGAHIGERLAIVLDGVVRSAPVIEARIEGNAQITGDFTTDEVRELRDVLKAGSLSAPLTLIEERFLSPTIGNDSINASKNAIVVGCIGVLAFLILYYRKLGVVAAIALILNIVLLPGFAVISSGFLSTFAPDATGSGSLMQLPVLTLAGIAGILLTIGMAVDANVLIFERTREEQASGRPTFASIMAGYQRAFLAIFDGNITTIITAIILFVFGTGSIRGFSVTLIAGILASMFTALVVTKLIFQATIKPTTSKKIKMMELVPPTVNFNFVKRAKLAILTSVLLIIVLDAIAIVRGLNSPSSIFDVDFTGGAKVTIEVENAEKAPLDKIRKSLTDFGFEDAKPQYQTQKIDGKEVSYLEITTTATADQENSTANNQANDSISSRITEALESNISEAKFHDKGTEYISSQIGSEMKSTAYKAILLSTLAMLIYITLRFEFGFALGAIVALIHDVLITIGIFTALGFQFNLTIVAAMLTIVGYGVNDTIVLFDRVREELKLNNKLTFPELANKCINVTLSRTLLTSITTLITVAALMIFTSGDIFSFATCMLIGIIVSTFSTIFIATPVMLAWYKNKRPYFAKK